MEKNPIQTADNVFSSQNRELILDYCESCEYTYGETDNGVNPPTGMVHNIPEDAKIYKLFKDQIELSVPEVKRMKLYRMYVNCFAPSENPYFHTDGNSGITFLYYPQEDWQLDDGGETQFYVDGTLYGITPESNRLVMFDARIVHRATSFRNRHRFTIAIKYE